MSTTHSLQGLVYITVRLIHLSKSKDSCFYLDDPDDITLLDAKWESLSLAPVNDSAFPDDYFLFTAVSFFRLSENYRAEESTSGG